MPIIFKRIDQVFEKGGIIYNIARVATTETARGAFLGAIESGPKEIRPCSAAHPSAEAQELSIPKADHSSHANIGLDVVCITMFKQMMSIRIHLFPVALD